MKTRGDIEENQIEEDVIKDKDSSNPLIRKWKQLRPSKMERYLDMYYLIAMFTIIDTWFVWNQLVRCKIILLGLHLKSMIQTSARRVIEPHTIGSGSLINAEDLDTFIRERCKRNFWTGFLLPRFQFEYVLFIIPSVIDGLMLQNGLDFRVLCLARWGICIYGIVHCTIVKNLFIQKFEEHKIQKEKQRKEQGIYYN